MLIPEIKEKITALAKTHSSEGGDDFGGIKHAEYLEEEALDMIISYCNDQGYTVKGFPKEIPEDEDADDYLCSERFQLYLDYLTLEKADVAELMWHYVSHFWSDMFESREDYVDCVRHQIASGNFYDVEL